MDAIVSVADARCGPRAWRRRTTPWYIEVLIIRRILLSLSLSLSLSRAPLIAYAQSCLILPNPRPPPARGWRHTRPVRPGDNSTLCWWRWWRTPYSTASVHLTSRRPSSICRRRFQQKPITAFLHHQSHATLVRTRTKFADRAFSVAGPATWNSLTPSLRLTGSHVQFRKQLKSHLFKLTFD